MPDALKDLTERLSQLSPDARARVESALKSSIEAELSEGPSLAKEFSRGIFFSRSRGATAGVEEAKIVDEMKAMDEATFTKFATRLATLKRLKETGGSK